MFKVYLLTRRYLLDSDKNLWSPYETINVYLNMRDCLQDIERLRIIYEDSPLCYDFVMDVHNVLTTTIH